MKKMMRKEEGRRRKKEEGMRRKNEEEGGQIRRRRTYKTKNNKKKWRNWRETKETKANCRHGARTDAPKPSKKDTRVGGTILPLNPVFDVWSAWSHYKNCAFRTTEEHPPKHPIFKNSQKPPTWTSQYPSFFSGTMQGLETSISIVFSQGQKKGFNQSPPNCQNWGANKHPWAYAYIYICCRDRIPGHILASQK